jgi:hypothetical protein
MTTPVAGLACVAVAIVTALTSIILLVASGGTNGFENVVIVVLLALTTTFATAYGVTRHTKTAVSLALFATVLTVGGGFALLYVFFSWTCGTNPSSC